MATIKNVIGTRTVIISGSLATLASATYCLSSAVDCTANQPIDLLVELAVTPGTVSGNKQALIFATASLDNINYQTGPTSGTTATDEPDLTFIGSLPLNSNTTIQRKVFSVAAAYGGTLPPYVKFVVKNDSGAAFTTGTLYYSEVSATVS